MATSRKKKSKSAVSRSRKPETKKPVKRNGSGAISMETYRDLRDAYIEQPSIRHAARVAGVRFETARKYIKEGRPDKNMPAIETIARAEARKEQSALEYTLQSFRKDRRKEIMEVLTGTVLELQIHREKSRKLAEKVKKERKKGENGEIIEPSSKLIEEVKAMDMLVRLYERMSGEPDERVTVDDSDYTKRMDREELVAFLKKGKVPERLR